MFVVNIRAFDEDENEMRVIHVLGFDTKAAALDFVAGMEADPECGEFDPGDVAVFATAPDWDCTGHDAGDMSCGQARLN